MNLSLPCSGWLPHGAALTACMLARFGSSIFTSSIDAAPAPTRLMPKARSCEIAWNEAFMVGLSNAQRGRGSIRKRDQGGSNAKRHGLGRPTSCHKGALLPYFFGVVIISTNFVQRSVCRSLMSMLVRCGGTESIVRRRSANLEGAQGRRGGRAALSEGSADLPRVGGGGVSAALRGGDGSTGAGEHRLISGGRVGDARRKSKTSPQECEGGVLSRSCRRSPSEKLSAKNERRCRRISTANAISADDDLRRRRSRPCCGLTATSSSGEHTYPRGATLRTSTPSSKRCGR